MIKKTDLYNLLAVACILTGGFLGLPDQGYAQFIDLRLNVDSELTATTKKPLEFGTLSANSGERMIEFGSAGMGIFSITGLEEQMLLITLEKPNALRHNNPAVEDEVPLQLFARYGFSSQNYQNSFPIPEPTINIKIEPNSDPGPWNTIYIFMYGSVTIGNVSNGVYSNQIVLNVEYI